VAAIFRWLVFGIFSFVDKCWLCDTDYSSGPGKAIGLVRLLFVYLDNNFWTKWPSA